MCGIAGVVCAEPSRPVPQELTKAMGAALAHRGPDGSGIWCAPGVALCHRRLAIIDLEGGNQPLGNENGSVQVVFNGEIYNYQDLRRQLVQRGHRFRTASDTEVLVHLYEEHGERLVECLRGMFAFALWDQKARRLLLARDRLGIKPLYYYRDTEKLVFGSELKALLANPTVPRAIDAAALEDYLAYGMVLGASTIFAGIAKLPPAHTLSISPDHWQASPKRYWRLHFEPDERPTPAEWQEALEAKVRETVRMHLISDVPVGAFLSGGLDSSIVVACAAGAIKGKLQTFSMGFAEERFSELPHARQVGEHFGTEHREEIVTPDAAALLDDLVHYYDEPFADSSAIPTFLVSRLARRHVKVVLSGDGGDEAFGGYARYAHDLREDAVRRRLPGSLRRRLLGPLGRIWPKADWLPRPLRAKTTLTNLAVDAASAYANTLAQCRPPLRRQLLAPDVARSLNGHRPEDLVRAGFSGGPPGDVLAGMLSADVETTLPDDFLVKVDRASMANGLEVRPPLLDHELLELAARIPSRWKVHHGETKWILKQTFRSALPAEILSRPKHGFEVPIDAWLRGPLRPMFEDCVLGSTSGAVGAFLNVKAIRGLYRSHNRGTGRYGAVLWSALVLARWADRYRKPDGATAPRSLIS
jgi:asparagine synthase (glutamine-hydrolysing)